MIDALPGMVAAMSEPMMSHDAIGFYMLSREVSEYVKVAQTGQGADEIFGGYHWYPMLMRSRAVAAWLGLTPRRFQSGEVDYDGHISRRGDSQFTRPQLYF